MAGGAQQDDEEITGINVTPLVDIVLVLLIIFMVTANFIVRETVEVDLPRAANGGETVQGLVNVVLDKEGKLYFDGAPVSEAELSPTGWQRVVRGVRHGLARVARAGVGGAAHPPARASRAAASRGAGHGGSHKASTAPAARGGGAEAGAPSAAEGPREASAHQGRRGSPSAASASRGCAASTERDASAEREASAPGGRHLHVLDDERGRLRGAGGQHPLRPHG